MMTLRQIRISKGISMTKAAKDLGLSRQSYYNIEREGLHTASEKNGRKIAEYFDFDFFQMLGDGALKFKPNNDEERRSIVNAIGGKLHDEGR